jgi:hypothetical protein
MITLRYKTVIPDDESSMHKAQADALYGFFFT